MRLVGQRRVLAVIFRTRLWPSHPQWSFDHCGWSDSDSEMTACLVVADCVAATAALAALAPWRRPRHFSTTRSTAILLEGSYVHARNCTRWTVRSATHRTRSPVGCGLWPTGRWLGPDRPCPPWCPRLASWPGHCRAARRKISGSTRPRSSASSMPWTDHPGVEMHSLMVLRHGHVVAEGWWAPYSAGPAPAAVLTEQELHRHRCGVRAGRGPARPRRHRRLPLRRVRGRHHRSAQPVGEDPARRLDGQRPYPRDAGRGARPRPGRAGAGVPADPARP